MRAFDCTRVSYIFHSPRGNVSALDGIELHVEVNEFVSIVGPSGCGKTTLLKLIAGLLQPERGQIVFAPFLASDFPHAVLVLQDHGIFPWLTVLENVTFGLEMRGVSRRERNAKAGTLLERVGLSRFADKFPHELSIGMRQRVAVARAFVSGAPILLMDEPFAALDAQTRRVLQDELLELWERERKTVVFVTHDIDEAVRLGDRVVVMGARPGHIAAEIPIPLPRPRAWTLERETELTELKWRIWKMLEHQARRELNPLA